MTLAFWSCTQYMSAHLSPPGPLPPCACLLTRCLYTIIKPAVYVALHLSIHTRLPSTTWPYTICVIITYVHSYTVYSSPLQVVMTGTDSICHSSPPRPPFPPPAPPPPPGRRPPILVRDLTGSRDNDRLIYRDAIGSWVRPADCDSTIFFLLPRDTHTHTNGQCKKGCCATDCAAEGCCKEQ